MNIKTSSQNHNLSSSSSSLALSSQPRFNDETNGLHYLNLNSPSNHHHQQPSIDHQHHYHPFQQQQQQLSKTWTNGANISNIQSTIYPPSSPKPSYNNSNNLNNTYSSGSSSNRNVRNTTNSGPSAIVRMKIKIPAAEESSRSSLKLSIPTVYNMNKIKIDSSEATGMYKSS